MNDEELNQKLLVAIQHGLTPKVLEIAAVKHDLRGIARNYNLDRTDVRYLVERWGIKEDQATLRLLLDQVA